VGIKIVEDDMDLPPRMPGHDTVHEVEELDAPAVAVVPGADLAVGDVEDGEQSCGAMPRVVWDWSLSARPLGSLR
jgi:hypothetical protein